MTIISLLTDFGLRDGFVGVMKGVIWKINPDVQIADITHFIQPQDIRQGALALLRTTKYFSRGTVHIAVVDPGVGTDRRPLAAEVEGHFFVGPDNGLFSLVFREAQELGAKIKTFTLDRPQYWLPEISTVFHGRDIFAPVGAHLSRGLAIEEMGTPLASPVMLSIPQAHSIPGGLAGEVIEVDNFGNLATNIRREMLTPGQAITVKAGRETIHGLARTFGDSPEGDLVATIGTENDLMIAVVKGSAAMRLNMKVGDAVEVHFSKDAS
jgi:S-adenosylmethionine hydrolase